MEIKLRQQYKSISALTTEDLPDFVLLIGRNGAGKTQILSALAEGVATIPGIGRNENELHNLSSFHPPNTNPAGRNTNQLALNTADAYLLSQSGGSSPIKTAAAIFDQSSSDIESEHGVQARDDFVSSLRAEIQHIVDFTVYAANDQDSPYKQALYDQVLGTVTK